MDSSNETDGGGEFINVALKNFCNKKGIYIRYTTPYMHKENGITK